MSSNDLTLQRLFAETPVFIAYATLPDLRLEFVNKAFGRLYHGRELQGRTVAEALPEAAEQGFQAILENVIATGKHWAGFDVPLAISDPLTGKVEVKYVDFIYQPVMNDTGQTVGVACSGYDVSERHRLRLEGERLRHQVQHVSRINAMGAMAMTLAHELNQPLAAAANLVAAGRKLLLSGSQPDEAAAAALLHAEEQIVCAGDINRKMRSVVKSGRAERMPVRIEDVLDKARTLLDWDGSPTLMVTGRFPADAKHVLADPIQLEQILLNLLRNAAEASRNTPRKEAIVVSERISQDLVSLTVTDFGPGLPPEQLDSILAGRAIIHGDGLGIGLPLTRTLVEANSGTFTAANAEHAGAVFRFTLAATADAEPVISHKC